ncbi:MAG: murein biosynthesis integral membrane protein MurJ [candidate division WOR-3 bacterium]
MRRGALIIAVMTILAKALGFVRELLMAYFFGAAGVMDAYRVGETVNSLGAGMVSSLFDVAGLPLLVERNARAGEQAQRQLFASLWTTGALVAGSIALLTLALAPLCVRLFAPRLSGPTFGLAVTTTRILVPVGFVTIMVGAFGAYYNARRQFAVPKLVDPVINAVAIVVLVFWARRAGVLGLAAGWSLGQILGLAVAILPLVMTGHRLVRTLSDPGVRAFVKLALPVLAAGAVRPLTIAAARAFASFLPEGSIAMLGYADRLFAFPCYLLAASISTTFFTKAAELAAADKHGQLREQTNRLLSRLAAILIPTSLALLVLARPVVKLLYERGAFTGQAAVGTAAALAFLGIGLFPFAAVSVLSAAFRARRDVRTPAYAAFAGAAASIALDLLLVRPMGVSGLALASSCGLAVAMSYLWARFERRHGG